MQMLFPANPNGSVPYMFCTVVGMDVYLSRLTRKLSVSLIQGHEHLFSYKITECRQHPSSGLNTQKCMGCKPVYKVLNMYWHMDTDQKYHVYIQFTLHMYIIMYATKYKVQDQYPQPYNMYIYYVARSATWEHTAIIPYSFHIDMCQ